jgi:hypothetical protein
MARSARVIAVLWALAFELTGVVYVLLWLWSLHVLRAFAVVVAVGSVVSVLCVWLAARRAAKAIGASTVWSACHAGLVVFLAGLLSGAAAAALCLAIMGSVGRAQLEISAFIATFLLTVVVAVQWFFVPAVVLGAAYGLTVRAALKRTVPA